MLGGVLSSRFAYSHLFVCRYDAGTCLFQASETTKLSCRFYRCACRSLPLVNAISGEPSCACSSPLVHPLIFRSISAGGAADIAGDGAEGWSVPPMPCELVQHCMVRALRTGFIPCVCILFP